MTARCGSGEIVRSQMVVVQNRLLHKTRVLKGYKRPPTHPAAQSRSMSSIEPSSVWRRGIEDQKKRLQESLTRDEVGNKPKEA